jgi:hypothetical protein
VQLLRDVGGVGLLWLNEAAPALRSNIPQTALVATLDTYDLFRFPTCCSACCSVILTPTKSGTFLCQFVNFLSQMQESYSDFLYAAVHVSF